MNDKRKLADSRQTGLDLWVPLKENGQKTFKVVH